MNRWPWPWKQRPTHGQSGANPTPPANVPVNATGGVSSPSSGQGATTPLPTPRSALLGHPGANQGVSRGTGPTSFVPTCPSCSHPMVQNLVNLLWECNNPACPNSSGNGYQQLLQQMQGMGANPWQQGIQQYHPPTCPKCGWTMAGVTCSNPSCTYVNPIVNGTGTTGIKPSKWMVKKGSGDIVDIKGRPPISPEQRDALDAWLMRNMDAMRRLGIELPPSWEEPDSEE